MKVLNRRDGNDPPGGVYVGRPTKWGNPFVIGPDGTRGDVVRKFRAYLAQHPQLRALAREQLRGRDLVCWCAPKQCHADVLMEVANSEEVAPCETRTR